LVDIRGRGVARPGPGALARPARPLALHGQRFEYPQQGLGGREVDLPPWGLGMALPMARLGRQAEGREQARHRIAEWEVHVLGAALGLTTEVGQTTHGLEDAGEAGAPRGRAGLAKAGQA